MDWLVSIRGREAIDDGAVTFHGGGELPRRFVLGPAPWPSLSRVTAGDVLWLATRRGRGDAAKWLLLGRLEVSESGSSERWVEPRTWWLAGTPRIFRRPRPAGDLFGRLALAHGRGLGPPSKWARVTGRPVRLRDADARLLAKGRRALVPLRESPPEGEASDRLVQVFQRAMGPWERLEDEDLPGWTLPGKEGVRLFVDPADRVHLVALRHALDASFLDGLVDALVLSQSRGARWRISALVEEGAEVGVVVVLQSPGDAPGPG